VVFFPSATAIAQGRVGRAFLRPHNWVQLAKFSTVGASGYVINLVVYTALLRGAGFHYAAAATCSFVVAVTNNYVWNRLWTFHAQRGHLCWQGLRFLIVALVGYGANLAILSGLIALGTDKVLAQAIAVVLVTPMNFIGNKLWSFRTVLETAHAAQD
jgi:putative flippase GtrA